MTRREKIIDLIRKTANVYLPEGTVVFIFGSQANQSELKASDIDIGLKGKEQLSHELRLDFKEALEGLPTLYTFDVVDFNRAEDGFKGVALRNVEYIVNGRD